MPTINHVHTYQRLKSNKRKFRCSDKYCTHVADREMLLGKACLCNLCGKEFVLTGDDLKYSKPRCLLCKNTKEAALARQSHELLEKLGITEEMIHDDF